MRRHLANAFGVFSLVVGIMVSGCSGGGGGSSTPPPGPVPTTTTLSLSNSSVNAGASVTLTATITSTGGAVTAGSVTFYDGTTSLGTSMVNASAQATWSSTSIDSGAHNLTASYGGSAAFAASTSGVKTLTVTTPSLPSSVALSVSSSSATQGLPVELIANVSGTSSSTLPTGSVTFDAGATVLGSASVDSTGTASFTTTKLPVGANSLMADYAGDTTFATASSALVNIQVIASAAATFTNPLTLTVSSSVQAPSCADPAMYKDQENSVNTWYLYCTSDALYPGDPNVHYLNIFKSSDLVRYSYVGSAFSGLPSWANTNGSALWAPAIKKINGQYLLYYADPVTTLTGGGSAIGVGVSSSPAGPFIDHGSPAVEPELAADCCAGSYRSTIDPDEIQDALGQRYILFGSFSGGLYVRKLSSDGLTSDPASEVQIAADNRYEGGNWWFHGGYYYLFASSTNCCNGPLSGYGVFVGRASTPLGPYLDAQGIDMVATNPGGTPVLKMNGNGIIGPGGNVIFTDESGQDYILYHGILAATPYYSGNVGYTARPGFIDALDWENGWPVARGGFGPSYSDAPQPLPAAQPGATNSYTPTAASAEIPRTQIIASSDEFNSTSLSSQWSFLHMTPAYVLTGTAYQVSSVAYDPVNAMVNVPLLSEATPVGDYMVETKVDINLPISGVGPDFAQAGLLIYGDDNNFVREDLYNNNDTRQVEFIKAQTPQANGYPSWGGSSVGPPAISTDVNVWMRIAKRNVNGEEHYTAYSSNDGTTWTMSGTWVHSLGNSAKICLYAGNRSGYKASFDYVHLSTLE